MLKEMLNESLSEFCYRYHIVLQLQDPRIIHYPYVKAITFRLANSTHKSSFQTSSPHLHLLSTQIHGRVNEGQAQLQNLFFLEVSLDTFNWLDTHHVCCHLIPCISHQNQKLYYNNYNYFSCPPTHRHT